jgi:superfamily I DNA and/or RNA helicase
MKVRSTSGALCRPNFLGAATGYLLSVNYRNHPQIIELFNRNIYKGKLRPGPSNSEPERVGDTWDEFTSKRHHFHGQVLAGVRRLFVSVIGTATREKQGTSFENVSQAVVIRDVLAELYSFTTAGVRVSGLKT